jgi:hypothetical protein
MNRFQGIDSVSLWSLAGRYDNPIPARFLAPIDCSKIPAQLGDRKLAHVPMFDDNVYNIFFFYYLLDVTTPPIHLQAEADKLAATHKRTEPVLLDIMER